MKINLSDVRVGDYVWSYRYMGYVRVIEVTAEYFTTAFHHVRFDGHIVNSKQLKPQFFKDHEECIDYIKEEAAKYTNLKKDPELAQRTFQELRKDLYD